MITQLTHSIMKVTSCSCEYAGVYSVHDEYLPVCKDKIHACEVCGCTRAFSDYIKRTHENY